MEVCERECKRRGEYKEEKSEREKEKVGVCRIEIKPVTLELGLKESGGEIAGSRPTDHLR